EETFEDERPLSRDAYYKDGERRDAFVAATLTGRILTVVYTQRGSAIRVITAYRTRGRLRREYLEGR
ncbi:MAG: BrnT family toxin, partial [Chloroflexi bacterium]|nr:BrnT family toxin [Chloroflexota bacterium]